MNITKQHHTSKQEDYMIVPFLEHKYKNIDPLVFTAITEDKAKRPDYYVLTTNTVIEIKEIHDKEWNERHAKWSKIISRLQHSVDNHILKSKVQGTYLVNTPERIKSPTDESSFQKAATEILEAVINHELTVNIFGFEFKIEEVSKQESIVVFGTFDGAGSIDPAGVVYENIKDKLRTANEQLTNPPPDIQPTQHIVVLADKYYFPMWDWDLYKAISRTYSDLIKYSNIDEIWYQYKSEELGYIHRLLYKKSFFEEFESGIYSNFRSDDYELFANWFSALSEMGDEKKTKLLMALKYFLKDAKPYQIFIEHSKREEIVKFGLWIAEQELYDDLVWFIEKFIDDPDPSESGDDTNIEKVNLHLKIKQNKEVNSITTVLGHLAWVLQKLAMNQKYIVRAFDINKKLFEHQNLYVILESIIPFIEIAARRKWLKEFDDLNGTEYYKDFHKIAFQLLNKYSQYSSIANWLTSIFYYFTDLDTNETLEVLNKLSTAENAASLFVYYGIFRERHPKAEIEFNSVTIKAKLSQVILANDNHSLTGSIVWNFRNILLENPEEFDNLKPYLDQVFSLKYDKSIYRNLEMIIEEWIERKPEICIPWFISMIDKIKDEVTANPDQAYDFWIDSDTSIEFIAKTRPDLVGEVIINLVCIWKVGAYIGSIKKIFESFKLIDDERLRSELKAQFINLYQEMKGLNPKLEIIVWDE